MKMSRFEKLFVNNPISAFGQKRTARLMLQLGSSVKGGKVLEIGCGWGKGVELILDLFGAASVDAFEVDPNQLLLAKKRLLPGHKDNVRLFEASATDIPSPDSAYDAVFDFNVLHHIPDNDKAIKEIARVLKPGGRFFFQEFLVSYATRLIVRLFVHHPQEGQFTWKELSEKLAKAGMAVSEKSCHVRSYLVTGVALKS